MLKTAEDKQVAFKLAEDENRIVPWAVYGEHISIKCTKCGTVYSTKNIQCIGARSIFTRSGEKGPCCIGGLEIDNLVPVEPKEWDLV